MLQTLIFKTLISKSPRNYLGKMQHDIGGQLDECTSTSFQINSLNLQTKTIFHKMATAHVSVIYIELRFWTVCAVELISPVPQLFKLSESLTKVCLYLPLPASSFVFYLILQVSGPSLEAAHKPALVDLGLPSLMQNYPSFAAMGRM